MMEPDVEVGARRWWALAGLSLAVLVVSLDGTVLSVALPTLSTALHASESELQWFSSAYLLVLAASMLPVGLVGDRYGRKRTMVAGLVLFGGGSAWCAAATSPAAFIEARVALGVAGAAIIVMALSALTVLFDEEERPRAVGVWAAANFVSLPLGPILGGWLLTHFWWGWVFLMNVPVAVVGLVATLALVPESRAVPPPALDPFGVLASVAGLVGVTYGLIEAGQYGWSDRRAWPVVLAGIGILVGFFAWERHLNRAPGGGGLLDLGLFRSASYLWGVVLSAVGVLAMIGVLFTMPQYFQGVLGADAMGSGLRLLPLVGGLVATALPADRLARRIGAKLTAAGGFALLAGGLALGSTTTLASGGGFVAGWMAVIGAGMGLVMATTASAALAELTEERAGVGSAVMQALNKVGGPLGTAVMGSALTAAYLARLTLPGLPAPLAAACRQSIFGALAVAGHLGAPALAHEARAAFVHGMDVALLVSAAVAAGGALLALAFLPAAAHAARPAPAAGRPEVGVADR